MSTSTLELPAPVIADHSTLRGRALVPVLVFVGLLVSLISSLGAPLIPTISDDFGVSLGTAQWSLTVTLLVGAVATPAVGRIADGPHRRTVLLAALVTMAVGCVLSALPVHAFGLFILGRALQGIGLSLMPLAMSVARDHLAPLQARSALATLSVTTVIGIGLGYPVTGLITQHLDLRAAYWVGAGFAVLAILAAALAVPASTHKPWTRFDLLGALTLGTGLGLLLLCISEGEDWGWGGAPTLGCAIGGLVLLGFWGWHQLRTRHPLVDLRLMRHHAVLTANIAGVITGIGMYMFMSMVIRYVQTPKSVSYGLGESVFIAGLALLPMSVTSALSSRLANALGRWLSPAKILPIGSLGFVLSLVLFGMARSQLWEILIAMAIGGLAMGCSFAVMPRMIVAAIPAEETGSALALNQVVRTVGYSIGSALSAAILAAHTPVGELLPLNRGYTIGSLVGIVLCLISAVVSWALAGRGAAGHTELTADQEVAVEESVDGAIAGVIMYEPD